MSISAANSQSLRDRWHALCPRVGAFKQVEESDLTFDMLATLYAHPARAYHNLEHIAQLLGVFDSIAGLAENRDLVEFSLWLHDCVYFPERPDNEERSADAAAMIAGLLGCTPEFTQGVRSCIAVTRHSKPPGKGDQALVADIDLSILAGTREQYDEYRGQIRAEFAFASDELFVEGRRAFVLRMLDKPAVYATPYFSRESERRARENLERELEELEQGLAQSRV